MTEALPAVVKNCEKLSGRGAARAAPAALGNSLFEDCHGTRLAPRGKMALILIELTLRPNGLTAAEAWPITTGLSEFISRLRSRWQLDIETTMEPNTYGAGKHARYRLITPLKVIPRNVLF